MSDQDTQTPPVLQMTISKDDVIIAFNEAINKHVTEILKRSTTTTDVEAMIKRSFERKWSSTRDSNWFEDQVQETLQRTLWQSIDKAVKASGIEERMVELATEYVNSPEFNDGLRKRVIETVNTTTFHVPPPKKVE